MISLAGSQLTDVMSEEAMKLSHYSGEGITVKCYNANGDLAAVRSIPWEDLGTDPENDYTFTYNIPDTDPPYKYVMEYKTSSNIMDLTEQKYVSNTVTGKCGIAEAGQLLNPPDGGLIAVSKNVASVRSDHVTWEVKVEINGDALDGSIKLSEAQANDKGEITQPNLLPRVYIPPATAADGTELSHRNCQEALESLEIIGLEQGEKVRVYYYYNDDNQTYYDSDPSMWHDGVLTMTGFQSDPSEKWPNNKFYMYFYKDYDMNPGLNHPENGSEKRNITLRMNNSFPVAWANYARDYINASETYQPGIFTHKNWVVVNGTKATAAFNTQPTSIYKHVINNGQNYKANNPVMTVRVGDEESGYEQSVTYPAYRFSVSVNGIYSDDPIVIEDTFDTSIFKLFDCRDFGGMRTYVETLDENGNHDYRWINWIMPQFGGKSEIGWNGAGGSEGFTYRTDNQNADPDLNHTTDEITDHGRVISNDDVMVEETPTGLRFTFKNMQKFRKANGQYYNFYIVDYYLVPRSLEALAEIERRVASEEPKTAPITNTATFRADGQTTQQYAVIEATDFHGYESDDNYYLLPNSQEAVLIKNTKISTSVGVTKKWLGNLPQDATATICLWGYPEGGSPSDAKALATMVCTASQFPKEEPETGYKKDWSLLFENVPVTDDNDVPLEYFFTEISCSPGYEPSYPEDGTNAGADGIITNAVAKTSFSVTKQWRNTQDNLWPENVDEIILNIRRSNNKTGQDNSFLISCAVGPEGCTPDGLPQGASVSFLDKGNGKYLFTVDQLDKYAADGTLWNYTVTEEKIPLFDAVYEDRNHTDVTGTQKSAPDGGYIFNTGEVYNLTVSKTVTGNFGDRRAPFQFTVHMEYDDGEAFDGSLKYEKASPFEGAEGTLQFDAEGNATVSIGHAESVTFFNIPSGLLYSVTEERSSARGYTVQSSVNGTPRKQSESPYVNYGPIYDASGKALSDQRISYSNDKSRIIPTGLELQMGGSVALFLLFTFGLAFLMLRRRTSEDDR